MALARWLWRNLLPSYLVTFVVAFAGVTIHSYAFEGTDGLPLGRPASICCPRCGEYSAPRVDGYECQSCGHGVPYPRSR